MTEQRGSVTDSGVQYVSGGGVMNREGEVVESKVEQNAGNSGPYGIGRPNSFHLLAPSLALAALA